MIKLFIALLCCLALIWILRMLWKRRKLYIYSWSIPGPPSFPLIGSIHMFLGNSNDIMETVQNIQKRYTGLGKIWFGPSLFYLINVPEHIEKVISRALNKNEVYDFFIFFLGHGLFTARGEKWRKRRKCIMPAFNQKILDNFVNIFAHQSEIFADQLQNYIGEKNFELFHLISKCEMDITCETALGVEMHTQTSDCDFGTNFDRLLEITTYRVFRIWHHLKFTWRFYPISKEYSAVINKFQNFTSSVVKMKLEDYEAKKMLEKDSFTVNSDEGPHTRKRAFLDLILETSNFTEQELEEEVNVFIIAGSDTTTTAVTCLFTVLGMFQDIQQRVLEEILDIMGPDRTVVPTDLPEMKYTDRVIKETLRLFPVAAIFLRGIEENIDLGDAILPAGSSALFGPIHIHRNPKYWPDPLKFDPDRFLPENVAERHPCTYIPFSYGPRSCIGARYAMMNIKTLLASVLRKYKIFSEYKSIDEIQLKMNIVLRLKDGPKVWIEPR